MKEREKREAARARDMHATHIVLWQSSDRAVNSIIGLLAVMPPKKQDGSRRHEYRLEADHSQADTHVKFCAGDQTSDLKSHPLLTYD